MGGDDRQLRPDPGSPPPLTGAGTLDADALVRMFGRTAHPFVVIDTEGTITFVGESVRDVTGYEAENLVGRHMLEFLTPESQERAIQGLAELNEFKAEVVGVPMVFELIDADGSTRWFEVGALVIDDVPGFDQVALRLRPWDATLHLDRAFTAVLAGEPLEVVCAELGRSLCHQLEGDGTLVHHGFDGRSFAAALGWGVPDELIRGDEGPWHRCVITGEPLWATVDDFPPDLVAPARAAGIEAVWCMPVPDRSDLAPAVVSVWRKAPGAPLLGHRLALDRCAVYAQLILVRWAEHQHLIHLAGHDALTGVANRTRFRDRLAEALAIGERDLAVAFLDLDGFKEVNDTYGHAAGDTVLVAVAERLRNSLRVGDELARIGGDEFTFILRNITDANDAEHVAERLMAAMVNPVSVSGETVEIRMSIGIALVRSGHDADRLLGLADAALYQVKARGGHGTEVVGADP